MEIKKKQFHVSEDSYKKLLEIAKKENESVDLMFNQALLNGLYSLKHSQLIKYYSEKTGLQINGVCCKNRPQFLIIYYIGNNESNWLVCNDCSMEEVFSRRIKERKDISEL